MTLAAVLLLAGSGAQAAEDTAQDTVQDSALDVALDAGDTAIDSSATFADPVTDPEADRVVTSSEMAIMAREGLGSGSEWKLPGPIKITRPMAEIILDAPPDVYLSFGLDALEVDVFAIMSEAFAEKLEYNRPDFFNAQGQPTVLCTGTATFPQPDAPPVISDCEPVFGE